MKKLSSRDKGLSDVTLEIVVTCAIYSCHQPGSFNADLANYVIKQGYIKDDGQGYLRLTEKGKSLYDKLRVCVHDDTNNQKP